MRGGSASTCRLGAVLGASCATVHGMRSATPTGVRSRSSLVLVAALLGAAPGCLAHERPEGVARDAAPSGLDAAIPLDAAPLEVDATARPDAAAADARPCRPSLAPAVVRFEPAMALPASGATATWLGYEHDAVEDGARIHLDFCGGAAPCVVDLVVSHVGDALGAIHVPTGIEVTVASDGASYATIHIVDARRCAGCGGELELLAGRLASGLDPVLSVVTAGVVCSTGCGELRAIAVSANGSSVVATSGTPIDQPLFVRIASDYHAPCVVCDCAQPDVPATGLAAWSTGIFVPTP